MFAVGPAVRTTHGRTVTIPKQFGRQQMLLGKKKRKKTKKTKSQVYNEDEDEDEAETTFITDVTGDSSLQRDFLPFDEDDTDGGNESDNDVQEQLGYY